MSTSPQCIENDEIPAVVTRRVCDSRNISKTTESREVAIEKVMGVARQAMREVFLEGKLRVAPGTLGPVMRRLAQANPMNQAGSLTQLLLKKLLPILGDVRSRQPFTLYCEYLGESGIFAHNQIRVLIGSNAGIMVLDPWNATSSFYAIKGTTAAVVVPNRTSSNRYHVYNLDPLSGNIEVLSAGRGIDRCTLRRKGQSQSFSSVPMYAEAINESAATGACC